MSILLLAIVALVVIGAIAAGITVIVLLFVRGRTGHASLACPHCGEATPSNELHCRRCGRELAG